MTKTEFQREERYLVFKISDVIEHLTTTEALHLARLYEIQRVGRKEAGKSELECVVVEKDWPEYEPTWRAIEARVTGTQAQPAPSVPVPKTGKDLLGKSGLCAESDTPKILLDLLSVEIGELRAKSAELGK